MKVPGQPLPSRTHDCIVVPSKEGLGKRAEHVHPPLSGAHLPVEAHRGEASFLAEAPAAATFEFALDPPREQVQGFNPGYKCDKGQTVGQCTFPDVALPGTQSVGIAAIKGLDAHNSFPPTRPPFRVVNGVPHGLEGGVELPPRD